MDIMKNKPLLIIVGIVVAIIALSILAVFGLAALLYLGVFNVSPPEVCTMPVGISCTGAHLSGGTDMLDVTLVNGLQKTIVVSGVTCTMSSSQYSQASETVLRLGERATFVTTCNDPAGNPMSFDSGETFSGKINVEYYFQDEGPSAKRRMSGNVYAVAK